MGFERATIQFLFNAKKAGIAFDKVLTIGRQGMHVTAKELAELSTANGMPLDEAGASALLTADKGYCEPFLRRIGAGTVDSMDISGYEAATLLHDMNQPLGAEHHGRYSFVIDGGSMEHVFHYPVALKNCMQATAVGGHFATITPANNLMGHGFYQISPELLFRALSPANGFKVTHMIVFEDPWSGEWFEVTDPEVARSRVQLINSRPAMLIACALRTSAVPVFAQPPQQSDYSALWQDTEGRQISVAETVKKPPATLLRRVMPAEWIRWLHLWQPFHPRLYRRLP